MKVQYMISDLSFKEKPGKEDAGKVNNSLYATSGTIRELFSALTSGRAFTPAICSGKRNNDNWTGAQIFALDFDSGVSIADALEHFEGHNLKPSFLYKSFSWSEEKEKFRLVWAFDTFVEDLDLWKMIQRAFLNIAQSMRNDIEVVDSLKDQSRMYYGTSKGGDFFSGSPMSLDSHIATFDTFGSPGKKVTKNHVRKVAKDTLKKREPKNAFVINNIISNAKNGSRNEKARNFDFALAISRSPELQKFVDGVHMKYAKLFALATNLYNIEGGEKFYTHYMEKHGYPELDREIMANVKRYDYKPQSIESFDPSLIGECENLLSLGYDETRGQVEIIDPVARAKKPHDILTRQLRTAIMSIDYRLRQYSDQVIPFDELAEFMDPPKPINIIRSGTGSGKTEHLVKLQNVLIAVPTHKLKDELAERMKSRGIDVICTPELPDFSPEIRSQIELYYSLGQNKTATRLITDLAKNKNTLFDETTNEVQRLLDSKKAQKYLDELNEALSSDYTCITTHQRAVLGASMFKNKRMVIFDEDPLKTLLPITTIKVKDLLMYKHRLESELNEKKEYNQLTFDLDLQDLPELRDRKMKVYRNIIAEILSIIENLITQPLIQVNEVPFWRLSDETREILSQTTIGQQIVRLTHYDYMMREKTLSPDGDFIHLVKKYELPSHVPCMICSATIIEDIYRKLIRNEDSLSFVDLGVLENKQPVIQYTKKMYSKNQLKNAHTILPPVDPDAHVITFLKSKKRFENADPEVHFFNTEGFDHLKGEKVSVIGTPLYNQTHLFLLASAIGIEIPKEEDALKRIYRPFTINGAKFSAFTYGSDELAKLDIQLTLMELEQASGRARTGVSDAQLSIFSNIPTMTADEFRTK